MIRVHLMKAFVEVPLDGVHYGVIGPHGVEVEVDDEGGGPFLVCKVRDEHTVSENSGLCLSTEEEIDQVADALKQLLRQAEASVAKPSE